MPKKCIICGGDAQFHIKDSSECYCEDCAKENFSDLNLLQRVEQQALKIKELMKEE